MTPTPRSHVPELKRGLIGCMIRPGFTPGGFMKDSPGRPRLERGTGEIKEAASRVLERRVKLP